MSSTALVARELERDLARIIPVLWDHGWLPAEVVRQIKRVTSARGERLVVTAIAVDHQRRDRSTLHPQWKLHVDQLGLPSRVRVDGWLQSMEPGGWSVAAAIGWKDTVDLASTIAFALSGLGPLSEIVPPPGSHRRPTTMVDLTAQTADPALTKVRHLLAQAESTNFDAEAEAFTAKAQELIARHSIDAALLWDRNERKERPVTIRIAIDDPYVDAKSLLLTVVAEQSRCRAVIHPRYALASLIGFESDLIWCETLYTSLLVQAQRELTRAGSVAQAGSRLRSRSFRSSFLTAYADRIGERLAEVNAHVRDEATAQASMENRFDRTEDHGGSTLLPVLADRHSAVDDEVDAQFGTLVNGGVRATRDLQGWIAGRQAADRAQLVRGDIEARRAS